MLITELGLSDLEKHSDILYLLLKDVYTTNFDVSDELLSSVLSEKLAQMKTFVEQGKAFIISAFESNDLVAFIWIYIHSVFDEERMHINQIAVNSRFRHRGIARRLVQEAEKKAKLMGLHSIDLWVSEKNQDALNLYFGMNFSTERRYLKKIFTQ